MYDVVVEQRGGYATDMSTGSRSRAVRRARQIAHAWPWGRRMVVRIIGPSEIVDFNREP